MGETQTACCLVLDDEPIIRMSVAQQLLSLGVPEVEECRSVDETIAFLDEAQPAFAIIDYRLSRHETSEPVAFRLQELGVPFAFASGLGELWKRIPAFEEVPVLAKPLDTDTLRRLLRGLSIV